MKLSSIVAIALASAVVGAPAVYAEEASCSKSSVSQPEPQCSKARLDAQAAANKNTRAAEAKEDPAASCSKTSVTSPEPKCSKAKLEAWHKAHPAKPGKATEKTPLSTEKN